MGQRPNGKQVTRQHARSLGLSRGMEHDNRYAQENASRDTLSARGCINAAANRKLDDDAYARSRVHAARTRK